VTDGGIVWIVQPDRPVGRQDQPPVSRADVEVRCSLRVLVRQRRAAFRAAERDAEGIGHAANDFAGNHR
jgi:hypothetical protein